jgi:hypothetical protein
MCFLCAVLKIHTQDGEHLYTGASIEADPTTQRVGDLQRI